MESGRIYEMVHLKIRCKRNIISNTYIWGANLHSDIKSKTDKDGLTVSMTIAKVLTASVSSS
jgi:hypothetical protein